MYVFKENRALVLFLFGSRHWFLALCPWLISQMLKVKIFIWGKEKNFFKMKLKVF